MALTELRSDLSWYGKNPGPYKTPANREATKFKGEDNIPYVSTGGYEFQGIALVSPVQRFAGNSFLIDTGTSSRRAQLGTGTRFPIGPEGQVHEFDIARTGFSNKAPYSRYYGIQHKNSGLANTYTLNSPIDDMYNKFNLRDDATPNSYIKHPLILRGIQRDGSSDPQRWGLDVGPGMSGAFDIPRGGILTAANRTLIDVARHAKFLASPRGIGFLAKQVGYQLMNPKAKTRVYNPLSLGSLAPIVHIDRQFGTDGILEGLVKKLAAGKIGYGTQDTSTLHKDLKKELFTQQQDITKGSEISTLSSKIGGPGSILGIGGTSITRHEDTRLAAQWGPDLSVDVKNYETRQFKYDNPYQQTKSETGGLYTIKQIDDGDNIKGQTNTRLLHGSLKETLEDRAVGWGFRNDIAPNGWIGGGRFKASSNVEELDYSGYETNNYEDLAAVAKGRTPKTTTVHDFLTKTDYNKESGETRPEKKLDTDFDGGGAPTKDANSIPVSDNIVKDYTRMAYGAMPSRTLSKKPTNIDFREIVQSTTAGGAQRWGTDPRIDTLDADLDKSLIKFKFGNIAFKAYIGSLNDVFAPSWEGQADHGRADARYLYSGFERTISLDFIVPIMKETERIAMWKKLEDLAQLTYPVYKNQGYHGQFVKVTIGDLFVRKDMIITDLGYAWDTDSPWEIDEGHQAPMYTSVSITFTVLGTKPTNVSPIYARTLTTSEEDIAAANEAAAARAAAARDILTGKKSVREWLDETF